MKSCDRQKVRHDRPKSLYANGRKILILFASLPLAAGCALVHAPVLRNASTDGTSYGVAFQTPFPPRISPWQKGFWNDFIFNSALALEYTKAKSDNWNYRYTIQVPGIGVDFKFIAHDSRGVDLAVNPFMGLVFGFMSGASKAGINGIVGQRRDSGDGIYGGFQLEKVWFSGDSKVPYRGSWELTPFGGFVAADQDKSKDFYEVHYKRYPANPRDSDSQKYWPFFGYQHQVLK